MTPVPGTTGQYTIRTTFQKPSGPQFLAYSRDCAKNEPFLAKSASAAIGVRWMMSNSSQLFATVDRACKTRFQISRFGAGTNASCAIPSTAAHQRSLKLLRSSTDLDGAVVRWKVEQFTPYPYPQVLQGDDTVCPSWEAQPMFGNVLECPDFGASVAIHEKTVVVGQTAAAYVIKLGNGGKWTRKMLPPPPPISGGDPYVLRQAPYSVAVSADLAVVGVPSYDIKPGSKIKRPGQVLVYQFAKLDAFPVLPRPFGAGVNWGATVQVSDDVLAAGDGKKIYIYRVSRPLESSLLDVTHMTPQAMLAGRSFVLWGSRLAVPSKHATLIYDYSVPTNKWVQSARINATGQAALHYDTLVLSSAGAGFDAIHLNISVYQRDDTGQWPLFQDIKEVWPLYSDGSVGDITGWSGPALDSQTLVFGGTSIKVDRSAYTHTHKVFIYTRTGPGGTWVRGAVVNSGETGQLMGTGPKAVAGDTIVCGAVGWQYVRSPPGVVYLYSRQRELAGSAGGGA